jgi:hypothetical protein
MMARTSAGRAFRISVLINKKSRVPCAGRG